MNAVALLLVPLILVLTPLDESPVGNWNMTLQVGHLGEGLRTVILEITKENDEYLARLTSMQNRMTEADEAQFDGKTLTVFYGSYEYVLDIDGDEARGTVTSPTGTQEVVAKRQDSQLFAGDDPQPYQKTWEGRVERKDDEYVIATRRGTFAFTNAAAFQATLESFLDKDAAVTGLWRIDRIEILEIEPWAGRRR